MKAEMVLGILHNHPSVANASEMFADALYTDPLCAQLHELMGDLGGFALNLTAKTDDEGDDLAFNLFQRCCRGKQDQREMQLVGDGTCLMSQCFDG